MRTRALVLAAVAMAAMTLATMTISACTSSKPASHGTSACAGGRSGTSSAAGTGLPEVGVLLPDIATSNRYTLYDAPLLRRAFDAAGIKSVIRNARDSPSSVISDAQTMIDQGVKVLLLDTADPQIGIRVEKAAAAAGVHVIDYDRVNLGGSACYYVSFDAEKGGELQADGLLDCLDEAGVSDPNVIVLNGPTGTDYDAVLAKAGAHKVFAARGIVPKVDRNVESGDSAAAAAFQLAYAQDPDVQGVLAADDAIAAAVITGLKDKRQIPVTGQGATIQGVQHILTGDQCLTLFEDVRKEAEAAANLAIGLIKGGTSKADTLATASLKDPQNGRTIRAVLLVPDVITKDSIRTVIEAGALTVAQICAPIQAACARAGLT